jgi:sn-glycerol 3-phosphate transport system permease protein
MEDRSLFRSRTTAWLFLAPTIIVLVVFLYYPALQSLVLSFYRSNLFLGTRKYIGTENYRNLFTGPFAPAFRQVFFQTILFSAVVVVGGIGAGVLLAVQANKPIRGARVYRVLLIWPFALSPAIAGTIYLFMFNPEVGIVNQILDAMFGIKPRWLDNPILAFILVSAAAVWKNLGYNLVFYLAGLQNIPKELYEAADLDGASGTRVFFTVTLPLLSPTTFFLVFTNIIYSIYGAFGLIDILTKGGPVGPPPFDEAGITSIFIYKIFQDGFAGSSNIGFAASQGVLLMLIVAGFTILQFRATERRVHYGGA